MSDFQELARKALREAISFAQSNLYTTTGRAWRQIIASLAFETQADLSLIQYFDEQDQAGRLAWQQHGVNFLDLLEMPAAIIKNFSRAVRAPRVEGQFEKLTRARF